MKVYVNQSKNRIMINFGMSIKNYMIAVLEKMIVICGILPSTCDCECNKEYKIDKYLDIKDCSCKKFIIDKLALECDTSQTLLNNKKVTFENRNCHIRKIS